jgi:hypothetical protein
MILQATNRWEQIGSAGDASTNTTTANDDDDDDENDTNYTATATTVKATATPALTTYITVLQALLIFSLIHKFPLLNGMRIVISSKQPTTDPYFEPNEIQFQPSDLIFPRHILLVMWFFHLPSFPKITQHIPVLVSHFFQAIYIFSTVHHGCHNSWESYCLVYQYETSQTVVLCMTPYLTVRGTQ